MFRVGSSGALRTIAGEGNAAAVALVFTDQMRASPSGHAELYLVSPLFQIPLLLAERLRERNRRRRPPRCRAGSERQVVCLRGGAVIFLANRGNLPAVLHIDLNRNRRPFVEIGLGPAAVAENIEFRRVPIIRQIHHRVIPGRAVRVFLRRHDDRIDSAADSGSRDAQIGELIDLREIRGRSIHNWRNRPP